METDKIIFGKKFKFWQVYEKPNGDIWVYAFGPKGGWRLIYAYESYGPSGTE